MFLFILEDNIVSVCPNSLKHNYNFEHKTVIHKWDPLRRKSRMSIIEDQETTLQ